MHLLYARFWHKALFDLRTEVEKTGDGYVLKSS